MNIIKLGTKHFAYFSWFETFRNDENNWINNSLKKFLILPARGAKNNLFLLRDIF
jgi:hypothetical protein